MGEESKDLHLSIVLISCLHRVLGQADLLSGYWSHLFILPHPKCESQPPSTGSIHLLLIAGGCGCVWVILKVWGQQGAHILLGRERAFQWILDNTVFKNSQTISVPGNWLSPGTTGSRHGPPNSPHSPTGCRWKRISQQLVLCIAIRSPLCFALGHCSCVLTWWCLPSHPERSSWHFSS